MSLGQIQWREPFWLLLALYPLASLFISLLLRRFRADQYSDTHLLPWVVVGASTPVRLLRLRHLGYLLAWCCLAIAMAGPRTAEKIYRSDYNDFTQVMIVLDVSRSMTARDVLPNRLARARLEILDFLQRADQVSVGLSVFAARPHLVSPLTYDKGAIRHYLDALSPSLLPTAGSNISDALLFAARTLAPSNRQSSAILLITDGDAAGFSNPLKQQQFATQLKQQGIRLFVLGVGTLAGQAVVNQRDTRRRETQTTITTLHRSALQRIATLTHGQYSDASDDNSDWDQLYTTGIARLSSSQDQGNATQHKVLWHEHFPLPLLLGFALFVLSFLAPSSKPSQSSSLSHYALLAFMLTFMSASPPLQAETASYRQAYRHYQQADYKQAITLFSRLPGFRSRLGEADTYYQQGDYEHARSTYIQAILEANNDQQRATALFNLGNTYYQLKEFEQAERLYRDVLRYQPGHQAASLNLQHALHEKRLLQEEQILSPRAGRGPRTGQAAENLDLSNTQVSLGDSENEQPLVTPDPSKPSTSGTSLLEETELATEKVERTDDVQWSYRLTSAADLQNQLQILDYQESHVWQRLFELEEGFPAPVPAPHKLPGVAPW
jgi:Ca-activated chloride channel family protein